MMRQMNRRGAARRVVLWRSQRLQGSLPATYEQQDQQASRTESPPYSPQTSPGNSSGGSEAVAPDNSPQEETAAPTVEDPMVAGEAAYDNGPQEETGFSFDDDEMEPEGAFSDYSMSEETGAQTANSARGSEYVASLPTVPRPTLGHDEDDQRCGICYETYTEDPIKLPCGHRFDSQCLLYWLSEAHSGMNTCPVCRRELFPTQRNYGNDGLGDVLGMMAMVQVQVFRPLTLRDRHGNLRANFREIREIIADNRRVVALEDCRVYGRLIDDGALLAPLNPHTAVLSLEEDRAMFQELRLRGAFDLPGMAELFQYRHPSMETDEENRDSDIYELLRNSRAHWCVPHDRWRIRDMHVRFGL